MAMRAPGWWPTVRELVGLFCAMGCVLREMPGYLEGPSGESGPVRFLYSPDADDFVSLRDLADDARLPPSEIANWERRLGMSIPKPDSLS